MPRPSRDVTTPGPGLPMSRGAVDFISPEEFVWVLRAGWIQGYSLLSHNGVFTEK
jgi:hypothetical protein